MKGKEVRRGIKGTGRKGRGERGDGWGGMEKG